MIKNTVLLLIIILIASCSTSKQTISPYIEVNLNSQWMFQKGGQRDDEFVPTEENWQWVNLPHSTRIEKKIVKRIDQQWQGISYYKKSIFIANEKSGNRVYLEFGAAMNIAEVFVNNEMVGKNLGGYLPFAFDITQYVQFGQNNSVLVKLNNMDSDITGPKPLDELDFIMYGGLYRDAKIVFKPQLHITYPFFGDAPQSGGIFVQSKNVSASGADLDIKTHVNNQSSDALSYQISHEIFAGEQSVKKLISSHNIAGKQDLIHTSKVHLDRPRLWHPKHPHLYKLRTSVIENGQLIQSIDSQFGVRKFSFNENHDLFINNEAIVLRGVNYHQDYPYIGYAKSKQAEYRDAKLIKEAGFDFVRLSHYPHSPYFLEAADKLGLVILNPMLGWQYYQPTAEFESNTLKSCRDLIRRDRNHPSVLAWECSLNETDMPQLFVNKLHKIVKAEFPASYSAGWMDGYDIYIEARQHEMKYPHQTKLNKPLIVSEYGDWEYLKLDAGKLQKNWHTLPNKHRSSRQLIQNGEQRLLQQVRNIHESHVDNMAKKPIADAYWVMFDYNRGKFSDLESSGIGSIDRLAKFSYFYFQSQRSPTHITTHYDSGPMVYIASDWTKDSAQHGVSVFSNVNMVKLFLNGVEQALIKNELQELDPTFKTVNSPLLFDIKQFEPGTLEAFAYLNGQIVAKHKVETPSETKRIQISVADQGVPVGKNDTVFVNATLLDANNNNTLKNRGKIKFYASKGIEIVNPENKNGIPSTKGVSVALIKTSGDFTKGKIWAELESSDIKSNIAVIEVNIIQKEPKS